MGLNNWEKAKITINWFIAYFTMGIALIILYPTFFLFFGYRILNKKRIRQQFAKIAKEKGATPIMVCPNHLTTIDSVLLVFAVLPWWKLFTHYHWVFWHVLDPINLPVLCPVLKVIPIERMGDRKKIELVKEKVKYLLNKGDFVVIFPEGTRSKTGRLDMESFQYGAGDILKDVKGCKVLCTYIRGDLQKQKSVIPPFGSKLDISMKLITPSTHHEGMRASRDISTQIMNGIHELEEEYFASHSDRK